jgi:MoxR-like ATPase
MIEIECTTDIEKDKPAQSSTKERKQDESKTKTDTQQTEVSEATEHDNQVEDQEENTTKDNSSCDLLVDSSTNSKDLKPGDIFYGSIKFINVNGKKCEKQGIFLITSSKTKGKRQQSKEFTLCNCVGNEQNVCSGAIKIADVKSEKKKKQIEKKAKETFRNKEDAKELVDKLEKKQEEEKRLKEIQFSFQSLEPEDKLKKLIEAGMNNIWMVGPAGCGKSTIARNIAKELDIPYLCISCGIGTSATEFTGYKYPTREATKFAEFYAKKSLILIDEMTALDPSVAQVINAALANGEIETTTGTVLRHSECIIVATSNTFGNGADRQYVANNQLDASTIDRFTGAIIEVDYSKKYESQFDQEVRDYIHLLRACIKINSLRRIASTRMIQAAEKMKKIGMSDWKDLLIINWSDTEKKIVGEYVKQVESNRLKRAIDIAIKQGSNWATFKAAA